MSTWFHGSDQEITGRLSLSRAGNGAASDRWANGAPDLRAIYLTTARWHAESYGDHLLSCGINEAEMLTVDAEALLTEWVPEVGHETAQDALTSYYADNVYAAFDLDNLLLDLANKAQAAGRAGAILDFGGLREGRRALGKLAVILDENAITGQEIGL